MRKTIFILFAVGLALILRGAYATSVCQGTCYATYQTSTGDITPLNGSCSYISENDCSESNGKDQAYILSGTGGAQCVYGNYDGGATEGCYAMTTCTLPEGVDSSTCLGESSNS